MYKRQVEDRDPKSIAYDMALNAFESAKSDHEMNLTRFKQENEAFDKKIEDGKKLVEELNQRFGDWYYVISASNLNTLQSTRADVVKPIEAPPGAATSAMPTTPDISFPNLPGGSTFDKEPAKTEEAMEPKADDPTSDKGEESSEPMKKETEEPTEEKPATETTEPVEEAKPADEAKPAEEAKPADEAKPAEKTEPKKETKAVEKVEPAEKPEPVETEEPPVAEEKPAVAEEKPAESGADDGDDG